MFPGNGRLRTQEDRDLSRIETRGRRPRRRAGFRVDYTHGPEEKKGARVRPVFRARNRAAQAREPSRFPRLPVDTAREKALLNFTMKTILLILLLLVLVAGCASEKVPERLPLTDTEKAAMAEYWGLFLKRDPEWPTARRKWLTMSEAAQNTLVENMIRYMSNTFSRNRFEEANRAAAELILLDRRSLEYLAFIVGDQRNSLGLREMAVGCLVRIGPAAVPGLIQSLESPRYQARRLSARALGRIGEKEAIKPLARLLREDENFVVRTEAALALKSFREDAAFAALAEAVRRDEEPPVVEAAAGSLAHQKRPDAVPPLVERLRQEERSGTSVGVPRALRAALVRITTLPSDSKYEAFLAWRPVAEKS